MSKRYIVIDDDGEGEPDLLYEHSSDHALFCETYNEAKELIDFLIATWPMLYTRSQYTIKEITWWPVQKSL